MFLKGDYVKYAYHTHTQNNKGDGKNPREVTDMFVALILVMVSWVYTSVQTH